MYLPTILGASLLLVGSSFGADTDSIPGYTIVPQSWEIEVSPGVIKTFNGTVQEMVAQAVAINPAFKLPAISSRAVTSPSKNSRSMPLARREVKFCNNFGPAKVDAILEGVQYLHRLGGIPTLPPGPGTCSRISCSYDSAIFWCNDVSSPLHLTPVSFSFSFLYLFSPSFPILN